jgi:zinc/manganese transport system ATP-binding protein
MSESLASTSSSTPPASGGIALHSVTVTYQRHPALHHLSGRFEPGSMTAVVGPNGAGKTTLLRALAGDLLLQSGHVDGLAAQRMAWLPQHSEIDRGFPISVHEMVMHGLWHQLGAWGWRRASHRAACDQALAAVGMTGMEQRPIDTLSGGQMQRALFARLILEDAAVILLDEPFAAVDEPTCADLLRLIAQWQREGKTVITVLHDLRLVRLHFPQTLLLARQAVAWGPTDRVLTEANWLRAQHMREPFDEHAPLCVHTEPSACTASAPASAQPVKEALAWPL